MVNRKKFEHLIFSTGILLIASTLPTSGFQLGSNSPFKVTKRSGPLTPLSTDEWAGEVASNTEDGRIRGCMISPDGETEFTIRIDGEEADLGKFGVAIYRKLTSDAKRQQFQGFRPGTIPPHLLPTYKAFAMDEVAREAILEAMQQNNIRPFENAREEMEIKEISIPPRKSKKKKGGKKKKGAAIIEAEEEAAPAWLTFDTMKEALKAGWEPGESFSFVATSCRGQKLKDIDTEASESLAALKNE